MKIKFVLFAFLLLLSSCYRIKQTSAQYERLPIKSVIDPSKEGKSCDERFFPFSFFYVDADISVETARKNAEIKDIYSIETEVSYRPFYRKICTVVKGQ